MNNIKSSTEQKGTNYLRDITMPLTAEIAEQLMNFLIFFCATGKLNEKGWHCIHIAEKDWWTDTKSKVSANTVRGSAWNTESHFATIGNQYTLDFHLQKTKDSLSDQPHNKWGLTISS